MLWTEIELECQASDTALRCAWATVFGVTPKVVAIVSAIEEADPWADPQVRIVLERRDQPGDFPLHVTVILGDAALDAQVATPAASLACVKQLCAALRCGCLIADDQPGAYTWLYVHPTGEVEAVHVNPDALDTDDALVIVRRTPVSAPR